MDDYVNQLSQIIDKKLHIYNKLSQLITQIKKDKL